MAVRVSPPLLLAMIGGSALALHAWQITETRTDRRLASLEKTLGRLEIAKHDWASRHGASRHDRISYEALREVGVNVNELPEEIDLGRSLDQPVTYAGRSIEWWQDVCRDGSNPCPL